MATPPCCRRLPRANFICISALAAFGFIFYFYSNSSDELDSLRSQFHLQHFQIEQLKNELIDSNIKMDTLRNSAFECKTNYETLEAKLKSCQGSPRKGSLGVFQQRNNNFGQHEKPLRGDLVPNKQQQEGAEGSQGENNYPRITAEGNFIPTRLWVHFDFKGAALKPSYFVALLPFLKKMGINGILLEWEDQFPYAGRLASVTNGDAYSMEDVEQMLKKAKDLDIEVVPLVQTFGHLEWVLKTEEFAHLREDPKYPQVICFGSPESWELIVDMISQVAEVHRRFGMHFFHIGADEVFQVGVCNESMQQIRRQESRERAILWHISRTASFVKEKYSVTVLAWHDMFVQMSDRELKSYNLPENLEPVLWSYAEDLDAYLPYSNWISLKPFGNVWGSSAFKGADGPMRYSTNPIHYIRNHESWIDQMSRVHREFERFQGLIITGWSRYDHLAVLTELFPVAIPTLAMSVETIMAGRPLNGFYEKTSKLIQCNPPMNPGYAFGCKFPGKRIYELVNEFAAHSRQLRKYIDSDFDFNGWVSAVAEKWNSSSPMYIEKVMPYIDFYLQPLERIERELREELPKYFYPEVADEFIFTYMSRDLAFLRSRKTAAKTIMKQRTFPKRPFVKYPPSQRVKDDNDIPHH